ncbi:MAG TPA: histone deacetylase [Anaerolineae bacterium]|nr:histone deacetylase [Anaerolineae bacterium]
MALPIVYHPDYVTPLPPEHRFPMPKFGMIYHLLLREGLITPEQVHQPVIASSRLLEQVHTPEYIQAFSLGTLDAKAQRRIGLPWSENLVKRTRTAVGGTVLTAQLALQYGLACNTAGGTHHAFPDFGSGFCIFNDLAVAARTIRASGLAKKILIVDLDVHQGDGTAVVFQTDPAVFTFSMHCQANFPFRKQQSDLDIGLPEGADDAAYLDSLGAHLPDLLSQTRPDLVLYDAGVDPHHADRLGKLALTDAGLYRRDQLVLQTCLAQGYPVATVVGGGYAADVTVLAYRHILLFRAALEAFKELS